MANLWFNLLLLQLFLPQALLKGKALLLKGKALLLKGKALHN
jgi:hypothetical protein